MNSEKISPSFFRPIRVGDILFDSSAYGGECIVLSSQVSPYVEDNNIRYTVKYLNDTVKGRLFQSLGGREVDFIRSPTVEDLRFMQKGKDQLFERELNNYENEYKDEIEGSYELLITNLRFYGLI